MELPLSSALAARLDWLPQAGSTNDVLAQAAAGPSAAAWPDLSVVATDDQVAGRGRLGRSWVAPAGASLAVSLLVRPRGASGEPVPVERFGMLSLLAGVAMARAVAGVLGEASGGVGSSVGAGSGAGAGAGARVALKWPNDVLIGEKKVCGILAELLPGADGVVIGTGVNLSLEAADLPTPTSTSLLLAGARPEDAAADRVLSAYLREFTALYAAWLSSDGDPEASGLLAAATEVSATLGRAVRVELPGGVFRTGVARAIDATGRLVVDTGDGGSPAELVVSAGDVTHLRHDDS
ncbi:biotin--[acetyl-CoA-carboxylase] ligase [Herbiconiux sp. 11R-BC]|uniref:biotin--[acetyl-CoA-carboxylase] ligase n=1 Tax=Herbiconiux sp. 11R-BC TaxID=3111637 RepID=UPI003C037252